MSDKAHSNSGNTGPAADGIDRRNFLRGTMAAGALVAAAALPGCGRGAAASDAPTKETTQTAEPKGIGTAPNIAESEITQNVSCDVVVIGAGIAGLAAARSAAEAGAKVVCIEKKKTIEVHGFEFAALNATIAKNAGVNEDPQKYLNEYQRRSAGRVDMRLISLFAENSGKVFDWWIQPVQDKPEVMKDISVMNWPLNPAHDRSGDLQQTFIGTMDFKEGGDSWLVTGQANQEAAVKAGAQFEFSTVAVRLVTNGGKVAGVIAKDANNKYTKFSASKGVVICTGAMGGELLPSIYAPSVVALAKRIGGAPAYPAEPMFTANSPTLGGVTGDGHLMALWAGAQIEPYADVTQDQADSIIGATAALTVNQHGQRVWNEDISIYMRHNSTLNQPGQITYDVFDANWRAALPYQGTGYRNMWPTDQPLNKFLTGNQYINALHGEIMSSVGVAEGVKSKVYAYPVHTVFGANTLEELAKLINVPADTLKATVDRYNQMCAARKDSDFGKDPQKLFPIATPPFFASPAKATVSAWSLAGLMTDGNLQCTDKDGKAIPGLWVAGNTCGQRFHPAYQPPMSGLTHGTGITHGYLAGQYAAKS